LLLRGALSPCHSSNEVNTRKTPYEFELNPEKFNLANFALETDSDNMDLFHRTEQFQIFFEQWNKTSKFQHYNIRTESRGNRVKLRQSRKNNRNDYIVMGSNDYLGLSSHPQVLDAAKKAIDGYGFGSTGSGVSTGLTDIHEELAELIAKTFKQEKALLYNSGYAANVGLISSLTREKDLIVADFNSHASIQDGLKMTRAEHRLFKHNDTKHLEGLLKEHRSTHSGTMVITEGVFSMDGDTPPLREIMKISKKYQARVMVDEAHSFGVVGPKGLGMWETCPRFYGYNSSLDSCSSFNRNADIFEDT
jgi:7-keto-8-aminopelargonate synthetase-like enzyme